MPRTSEFAPFGVAGIGSASGTIFFAFVGLDTVGTAGDEVKNPQKTMPRALIAALVIVTAFYVLVALAALGTQPWQEFGKQQDAGLATILDNVTGSSWAGTILAAGAVISICSIALVIMYGQTRILFALGRDGLLPARFAKVNPKTMTPIGNTVIVAVVILRVRQPDLPRGFKVPGYPVTPIHSVLACGYLLYGFQWYTWVAFASWVGVALVFYLAWSRHHSALNDGGDGIIATATPGVDDVRTGH